MSNNHQQVIKSRSFGKQPDARAGSVAGERFGRVPDPVLGDVELADGDIRVYAYLARWGNWSTGESDDARSAHCRIAEGTGRAVSSVKRSLRRLAERGHVEVIAMVSVHGDRAANRYRLVALDPRQPTLRSVPSPVEEPVEAEPMEWGGGVTSEPTPVQEWASKEPEFFSEQNTPPSPQAGKTATAPRRPGSQAGGDDELEPRTGVADGELGVPDEVLGRFRRVVPEARRCAFDRHAAGPGGQRLVVATGAWLAAGGSLEAVVGQATGSPLPELVHNWPAFLAARVEALEPPPRPVVHDQADDVAVAVVERDERRVADEAAAAGHAAVAAEAAAVSGGLGDDFLAAVAGRVAEGLPGVLGRSPFALSRAVVGFCRAAYAARPGDLEGAVAAALTDGPTFNADPDADWPPVPLPLPSAGTPSLQDRIRSLLRRADMSPADPV